MAGHGLSGTQSDLCIYTQVSVLNVRPTFAFLVFRSSALSTRHIPGNPVLPWISDQLSTWSIFDRNPTLSVWRPSACLSQGLLYLPMKSFPQAATYPLIHIGFLWHANSPMPYLRNISIPNNSSSPSSLLPSFSLKSILGLLTTLINWSENQEFSGDQNSH